MIDTSILIEEPANNGPLITDKYTISVFAVLRSFLRRSFLAAQAYRGPLERDLSEAVRDRYTIPNKEYFKKRFPWEECPRQRSPLDALLIQAHRIFLEDLVHTANLRL